MARLTAVLTSLFLLSIACNGDGGVTVSDAIPDTGGLEIAVGDSTVTPDTALDTAQVEDDAEPPADAVAPDLPGCETGSGCFGDPCADGSDCISGICVDHVGDRVCSQTCVEECPAGFLCLQVSLGGTDPIWACISEHPMLCRPCHDDDDCVSLSGHESACVLYPGQGRFCASPCQGGDEGACPEGFQCQGAQTHAGGMLNACMHGAGACPCSDTAVALGLTTPCQESNDFGTCEGVRTCTDTGLSPCDAAVPGEEICNGVDDDCDGVTDTGSCDDGNPCTQDGCDPAEGCFRLILHARVSEQIEDGGWEMEASRYGVAMCRGWSRADQSRCPMWVFAGCWLVGL